LLSDNFNRFYSRLENGLLIARFIRAGIHAENPASRKWRGPVGGKRSLRADNVSKFSALLSVEPTGRPVVLDLKNVVLVDREIVQFLHACETNGIELRNCPPYIRAWITQEATQA